MIDDRWGIYVNWQIDLDDPHHLEKWVDMPRGEAGAKHIREFFKDL